VTLKKNLSIKNQLMKEWQALLWYKTSVLNNRIIIEFQWIDRYRLFIMIMKRWGCTSVVVVYVF
jgi:hypothetical protein